MSETTFEINEGPSAEQQAAETEALAQGEKILEAQEAEKTAKYENIKSEQEDISLIGGKFKSQDDLLKAYNELQSKLGKGEEEEVKEESTEETTEETTEEVEEEVSEVGNAIAKASELYSEKGELTDESIEELSKMDSKDLIKAYVEHYSKTQATVQAAQTTAADEVSIKAVAGGEEGYNEMIGWAAENLAPEEIDAYNNVANSGNAAALKFAVEALNGRYKSSVGYEAPLVTGKAPSTSVKGYRSNAELARDISDPRYQNDPAFRQDVEARLAKSSNLL